MEGCSLRGRLPKGSLMIIDAFSEKIFYLKFKLLARSSILDINYFSKSTWNVSIVISQAATFANEKHCATGKVLSKTASLPNLTV